MQRKVARELRTLVVAVGLATSMIGCNNGGVKDAMQQNLISSKAYRLSIRTDRLFTFASATQTTGPVTLPAEFVFVLRALEMYDNGDTRIAFTFGPSNFALGQGSAVLDQTFSARISPRGRLSELSGLDAILAHIRALPKPAGAGGLGDPELMAGNLTEDSLLSLLNPALEIWPPVPVAPGETWTRAPIFSPHTNLYEHTTFTLKSAGSSVARIAFESVYRLGAEPSSEEAGSATGEIQVSPSQGTLRSSESKGTFSWKENRAEGLTTVTAEQTTYVAFAPL